MPWVSAFYPPVEVKLHGRTLNHKPPPSAKFKNEWSYTSTPPDALMTWTEKILPLPLSSSDYLQIKSWCDARMSCTALSNSYIGTEAVQIS